MIDHRWPQERSEIRKTLDKAIEAARALYSDVGPVGSMPAAIEDANASQVDGWLSIGKVFVFQKSGEMVLFVALWKPQTSGRKPKRVCRPSNREAASVITDKSHGTGIRLGGVERVRSVDKGPTGDRIGTSHQPLGGPRGNLSVD